MKLRYCISLHFLFLVMLTSSSLFSQTINNERLNENAINIRRELDFIRYCEGRHNYSDALLLLNRLNHISDAPLPLKDSIQFQLGWDYYAIKNLDSSAIFLLKVSSNSDQYLKARFFGGYDHLFLGHRTEAKSVFSGLVVPDKLKDSLESVAKQLIYLELGGIALLERNYPEFEKQASAFNFSYYTLAKEQKNLLEYHKLLTNLKPRSRWLAGMMSAVLPGSGKIYAGKTGEGVAAFLIVTSLGFVGLENFNKDGLYNWKTLLAGGLFSIYYTGNIIGSAKAASRYNHAYTQTLDNRILFDLHIPLRNIFN